MKSFFYFDHERYRQKGGATSGRALAPVDAGTPGRLPRLARRLGQPDPDLRPGDAALGCERQLRQGSVHGLRRQHAQRDLRRTASTRSSSRGWRRCRRPTSAGPLNNFLAPPIPDTILGDTDYYMWRIDVQCGNNHVFASFWHQRAPAKFYSQLPQPIATETYSDPQNSWVNRMNYDRIVSNTIVNHMSDGVPEPQRGLRLRQPGLRRSVPADRRRRRPQRAAADRDGRVQLATAAMPGVNLGNVTTRPTFIANDAVTWTKGAHTLKVGMEWRKIMGNIHANGNEAGSFNFGDGATGILGVNSGNEVASFLLGAADSANVDVPVGAELVSAPARVDPARGRQLAPEQQADARLRPAVGLLLALVREVRPDVVLRSGRRQPWRRRPARPAGVPGRQLRRRELRRAAIRRRTGTAGSPRGSAPSTRSTTRRSSAAGGASSTRRRSTRAGAAA